MKIITLQASGWKSIDDFYAALLPALGAPAGHGHDINALIDSVIGRGMNDVEPPYRIVISGTACLDKPVRDHLETAKFYLAKSRRETHADFDRDVDVAIEIVS